MKMKNQTKKTKERHPIFTKDEFLRVLDRAIKPPDQETQRTSEKSDSDDYSEKRTHSNNSEGT